MEGGLINVPSYIKDPLYRYKMQPIKLKIEGRGNGIKTNILNMLEISDKLEVRPDCINLLSRSTKVLGI